MINIQDETNQFVVFFLGEETYGVDINSVREIITMQSITKVPGTGGLIEGVINLRGHVIPVFNIKKKFSINEGELSATSRIVVVEVMDSTLGIIVDGVSEVLTIPREVIEKPSSMISKNISNDYIYGIAKLEEKLVIILELKVIIDDEKTMEKIS